jgi:hypothetical protein
MRKIPATPFAPLPLLFLEAPQESELCIFLKEAHQLVAEDPVIQDSIDADLDLHGQRKKALRILDKQWIESKTKPLPALEPMTIAVAAESLLLGTGRPRTNAYVVYLFLVGRGFLGGFKSADTTTLLLESMSLDLRRKASKNGTTRENDEPLTRPGVVSHCRHGWKNTFSARVDSEYPGNLLSQKEAKALLQGSRRG